MKLKKIVIDAENTAFGIRMVRKTSTCIPNITGLFLQDDDLEWTETAKEYVVAGSGTPAPSLPASFIPVRLLGTLCDASAHWTTSWQSAGGGASAPVFYGEGPIGVVGWPVAWNSDRFCFQPATGTLQVWATVAGKTYGPVTITFEGGGYY